MNEFHVRDDPSSSNGSSTNPRIKSPPNPSKMPGHFSYMASDDGTDENLLIILHGLGDTEKPFAKLGKSLHLPQTAVLALRAPRMVPFLYDEDAYEWYTSFDDLGEVIENPNPTAAIQYVGKVVSYLIKECAWPVDRIHLFGFAQGGSVVAEYGITYWKEHYLQRSRLAVKEESSETEPPNPQPSQKSFGSIVTVCSPLLSYPILSTVSPTPLLLFHRSPPAETALAPGALNVFKKGYQTIVEAKFASGPNVAGMPASKEEWEPIMRFWSQNLARRRAEGLYEVLTGSV